MHPDIAYLFLTNVMPNSSPRLPTRGWSMRPSLFLGYLLADASSLAVGGGYLARTGRCLKGIEKVWTVWRSASSSSPSCRGHDIVAGGLLGLDRRSRSRERRLVIFLLYLFGGRCCRKRNP